MSAAHKLKKHARTRTSPRSTRRQERRRQRRRLAELARRILARHYPDPSQECPF